MRGRARQRKNFPRIGLAQFTCIILLLQGLGQKRNCQEMGILGKSPVLNIRDQIMSLTLSSTPGSSNCGLKCLDLDPGAEGWGGMEAPVRCWELVSCEVNSCLGVGGHWPCRYVMSFGGRLIDRSRAFNQGWWDPLGNNGGSELEPSQGGSMYLENRRQRRSL